MIYRLTRCSLVAAVARNLLLIVFVYLFVYQLWIISILFCFSLLSVRSALSVIYYFWFMFVAISKEIAKQLPPPPLAPCSIILFNCQFALFALPPSLSLSLTGHKTICIFFSFHSFHSFIDSLQPAIVDSLIELFDRT